MEQVRFLDLDPRLREALEFLAHNLRRDGCLAAPLEELAQARPGTDVSLLERALATLQELDPPGVGARNLAECLLLQLDAEGDESPLVRRIIRDHLEDIRLNRLPAIARKTEATLEEVKEAVARIQALDPAPGRLYDAEAAPYIVPDVLIEYVDGRYEVSLNDGNAPQLRVSGMYRQLIQESGDNKETKDYIRKKLDSARWFIDSIQQRRNTLLKVSREIVGQQREFLDRGLGYLKPLKMQEVADATGMHVTTVSRAINGKHAQTPRGIFPLRFFFGGGVQKAAGESESFSAIRQRIREIVDKEDKSKPLSDDEIVAALLAQGVEIARRTVTKYRKAMGIPPSRRRRAY
jgi:RNA polymerase sigma-54 factor